MLYKVTDTGGRSLFHGGSGTWHKGIWRSVRGELEPCSNGLHLCREQDLMKWLGPVIWEAEVAPGASVIETGDKVVVSRARVVRRLDTWNERTARLFAADCAERVVHLCAGDPRPREAMAVARAFANGKATKEGLATVEDAARAAARAAAWDAEPAAEALPWYVAGDVYCMARRGANEMRSAAYRSLHGVHPEDVYPGGAGYHAWSVELERGCPPYWR